MEADDAQSNSSESGMAYLSFIDAGIMWRNYSITSPCVSRTKDSHGQKLAELKASASVWCWIINLLIHNQFRNSKPKNWPMEFWEGITFLWNLLKPRIPPSFRDVPTVCFYAALSFEGTSTPQVAEGANTGSTKRFDFLLKQTELFSHFMGNQKETSSCTYN